MQIDNANESRRDERKEYHALLHQLPDNQAEHHRTMTFKEEIEAFLKKHGMDDVKSDLE